MDVIFAKKNSDDLRLGQNSDSLGPGSLVGDSGKQVWETWGKSGKRAGDCWGEEGDEEGRPPTGLGPLLANFVFVSVPQIYFPVSPTKEFSPRLVSD